MFPDLPRKQRETQILQKYPAVFIIGIGWVLADGYPHEMRAADYDDWTTDTSKMTGKNTHGLNGDILVWNPVTKRRHELTSMGIRVTKDTLRQQLEISNQLDFLKLPYHQAILNDKIPLSIGGGIGQSRTLMWILKKAHLGEVSVTVWPKELKEICACHSQGHHCTFAIKSKPILMKKLLASIFAVFLIATSLLAQRDSPRDYNRLDCL